MLVEWPVADVWKIRDEEKIFFLFFFFSFSPRL